MALLILYLTVALAISFLCSLLEAALLSVPRSHAALMREQGKRAGEELEKLKNDMDRPLAAILTLNTFAHTLGAAGVGAQATVLWGEAWLGLVSVVMTLIILIFSEILPKTLGAVHSKKLAGFTAWTVHAMIVGLLPIVVVCDWISKLFTARSQSAPTISRDEVSSLASLAHQEGTIDENEAQVVRNLIALREIAVSDVMTPRTVMFTLRADLPVREVLGSRVPRFARFPVIGDSVDDVRGVVHRHDLDKSLLEGDPDALLGEVARPARFVPETSKLASVLRQFLEGRDQLFLVVDEYGGTAGLITLEDVLETLLGVEIVDESDSVVDMRWLAAQRQRWRLRRQS